MISGVLDGIVTSEDADSEDSPSLLTMLRWLQWFRMNLANIEGFLRNAGYGYLDWEKNFFSPILELEGYAAPGVLKRSTLERHLYRAGYGREQMQMYRDARGSSSKRFCKPHRMMLVVPTMSNVYVHFS